MFSINYNHLLTTMEDNPIHTHETSNLIKNKTFNAIKQYCVNDFGSFIAALVAVLLGAVLVNLWIRVINNFAYNFLNLNENSFFWSLVVALIATGILILYVTTILEENLSNQIKSNITGVTFGTTANVTNFTDDDNQMMMMGDN